ncbi:MAG: beta-glucanase [Henriciella sp.]
MNASLTYSLCTIAVCLIGITACAQDTEQASQPEPTEALTTDEITATEDSFVAILAGRHKDGWYKSNFSYPSNFYSVGWSADNIKFASDRVGLFIDSRATEHHPYSGAEYQKLGKYGYGRYEAIVKPAAGSGLVSSFFVYTGPYYNDPHHEVDIEFLGQDTTQMHPNLFVNGKPQNPPTINLGFDASKSFNLYAFEWEPGRVVWYVNDQKVLTVEKPVEYMPQFPGLIMANLWTGSEGQYAWHGKPDFEDGSNTQYKCISFQAMGDLDAKQCSDE